MEEYDSSNSLILLGRPFLKTSKANFDVDAGTLTMVFDCETVKFNIFGEVKYHVLSINAIIELNKVRLG
ncbi:hypothetical protein PTKIN_Ptkin01aG0137800 [Pterospermum kingtungense]